MLFLLVLSLLAPSPTPFILPAPHMINGKVLISRSLPLHILAIGSTVAVHACVAPILQQFRSSFPLFFCSNPILIIHGCRHCALLLLISHDSFDCSDGSIISNDAMNSGYLPSPSLLWSPPGPSFFSPQATA